MVLVLGSTRPAGMIPENSWGGGKVARQAVSAMTWRSCAVDFVGSCTTAMRSDLTGGGGIGGSGPGSGSVCERCQKTSLPDCVAYTRCKHLFGAARKTACVVVWSESGRAKRLPTAGVSSLAVAGPARLRAMSSMQFRSMIKSPIKARWLERGLPL